MAARESPWAAGLDDGWGSRHADRADIDGLRAIAVLAVLAFHAFPAAALGSFTGVDVFFVISTAPRIAVPALAASMTAVGCCGLVALHGHLSPHSPALPLVNEISRASSDWEYRGDRVIPGATHLRASAARARFDAIDRYIYVRSPSASAQSQGGTASDQRLPKKQKAP